MLIKKSITIKKHRTSLLLEKEFWEALEIISKEKQSSIEGLISKVPRLEGLFGFFQYYEM